MDSVLFSSSKGEWNTPIWLYRRAIDFLGDAFLDPCPENPPTDAFGYEWRGGLWLNPPYGRSIGKWVDKALNDPVDEALLLLPARTDTAWFQPLYTHTLLFLRGRLKFGESKTSAPFPSVLVYRGLRKVQFHIAFGDLGHVVQEVGE